MTRADELEGLRPCAHCGEEAVIEKTLHGRPMKWAQCNGCGASTGAFNQVEHAKAAWNRRADDDALASLNAEVEELRWERDELVFLLNEGGTWEQQLSAAERERDNLAALLKEAREVVAEIVAAEEAWNCDPADDERIAAAQSVARAFLDKLGDI